MSYLPGRPCFFSVKAEPLAAGDAAGWNGSFGGSRASAAMGRMTSARGPNMARCGPVTVGPLGIFGRKCADADAS